MGGGMGVGMGMGMGMGMGVGVGVGIRNATRGRKEPGKTAKSVLSACKQLA